mmetsp:Transcript_55336/g.152233  ORF Transcript_55336/g.152233 Transcript_55336/m.152233 type:complete len:250 (+) Transcript_55336:1042-1791(+)
MQRRVLRPVASVHVSAGLDERGDADGGVLAAHPVEGRPLLAVARVHVHLLAQHPLDQRERVRAVVEAAPELRREVEHRPLLVVDVLDAGAAVDEDERGLELPLRHRQPQRRLHRVVHRVDRRAALDGDADELILTIGGEPVQRRHVVLVGRRERRTLGDEELGAARRAALARQQQRRAQLAVLGLEVGAAREERLGAVERVQLAGHVQRRLVARAARVDVGTLGEQPAERVVVARAQRGPDVAHRRAQE